MDNITGIYKIVNTYNQKVYIGCSRDIGKRWKSHKYLLDKGKHHSVKLNNAWKKYGGDGFTFEIVEVLPNDTERKTLLELEESYIAEYNSFYEGYNCKESSVMDVYLTDWIKEFIELDKTPDSAVKVVVWCCNDKFYVSNTSSEDYYKINSGACEDREVNLKHFDGHIWQPLLVVGFDDKESSLGLHNFLKDLFGLNLKQVVAVLEKALDII